MSCSPAADSHGQYRQQIEELASFNRHVAHDLRGPLVTIAASAARAHQALAQGDTELSGRLLFLLQSKANRLSQLVSELLAMAEAADAPLLQSRLALDNIVREAVQQVEEQAHEHTAGDAAPQFVLHSPLPMVRCSHVLLRQVFVNLLSNAAKFASAARPPLIEIGADAGQAGECIVWVRDNGVGFEPAQAELLFHPFSRFHGHQYAGHGIGLSFVRRVVERHGGRTWAVPATPFGACFYISLPAIEPAACVLQQ